MYAPAAKFNLALLLSCDLVLLVLTFIISFYDFRICFAETKCTSALCNI